MIAQGWMPHLAKHSVLLFSQSLADFLFGVSLNPQSQQFLMQTASPVQGAGLCRKIFLHSCIGCIACQEGLHAKNA